MQAFPKLFTTVILVALASAVPVAASAGVTVEADVVVTDEAGGTLTLITSATHELAGSNFMTTGAFADFRPNPDGRSINGELVRVRVRDVESVESTFDGSLEISGPGGGDASILLLEGLTIQGSGDGPELSGTVVLDGQAFDAAELPKPIAAALRRVLRLFHFAA